MHKSSCSRKVEAYLNFIFSRLQFLKQNSPCLNCTFSDIGPESPFPKQPRDILVENYTRKLIIQPNENE